MAYKVKIFCKVCNSETTRNFASRRVERFKCMSCGEKRQLVYTDDHHAFAVRIEDYMKSPQKKIKRFDDEKVIAPTKDEEELFKEQSNKSDSDIKVEKITVEPRQDIATATPAIAAPMSKMQYLQPDHVKMLVQVPFQLLSFVTKYDGMKLTEKEAEDLGNNEAIQRTCDKYLGSFVGKYPDEYMALMFLGLTLAGKFQVYQKEKKESELYGRTNTGKTEQNRSQAGDNSDVARPREENIGTGTPTS